jgi:hypothetical protein
MVEGAVRALLLRYEAVRRLLHLDSPSTEQPALVVSSTGKRSIALVSSSDEESCKRVKS